MKEITTKEALRYNRQILMPGFDLDRQERLMSSSVLIIGAGGLGCTVAQFMAASGVGKITIVDKDIVELSNLPRQILHFERDIDRPKVASVEESLKLINSNVQVNSIQDHATQDNLPALLTGQDLVLDCSDNLDTRNAVNAISYKQGIPLVSGAAIQMQGQVFCSLPQDKSACYGCLSRYFNAQNLSCMESGVMSPLVGIIGATQALEAIKILTRFGELAINKLQVYDAFHSQWQMIKIKKHDACEVCGKDTL